MATLPIVCIHVASNNLNICTLIGMEPFLSEVVTHTGTHQYLPVPGRISLSFWVKVAMWGCDFFVVLCTSESSGVNEEMGQ